MAKYLSRTYQIPPEQIATIGDQPNDVLMFAQSGLSIAIRVPLKPWRLPHSRFV